MSTVRKAALLLFFLAIVGAVFAVETNYFCVVCGKGPLTGRIWKSKWGPVCDVCIKIPERCSLCGLPILNDFVKTGDGRFICKFDKTNAVLDLDTAKEVFADTRRDVVEMYGQSFALLYPEVTVNLFDVDYWSEKGRADGLHKFGFASTRKTSSGECSHEVVMLSGRLHDEMTATAAHEYTHLWINENRAADRVIDSDTIEAICELTAYNLMGEKKLPEMQKRILENPYTHGKINTLVAICQDHGIGYILNWVKNGTTESFDDANAAPLATTTSTLLFVARPLPAGLKFNGVLTIGDDREAVINGVSLAVGDEKSIKLRDKTVLVRCEEIHDYTVVVEVNESPDQITLEKSVEKLLP